MSFRDIERYQSNFGVFNAPQFSLGDIIDIDTNAKQGGRIRGLVPAANEIDETAPIDHTEIATDVAIDVTLSGEVTKASQPEKDAVTAQVKAYTNSNTVFFLKKHKRRNITDPVAKLNATPDARDDLKRRIAAANGHVYLIVQSLILADSAELRMSQQSGGTATTTVLKAGKFDLAVTYKQNATLNQAASGGAVFFKAVQVSDDGSGRLIAVAPTIDLRKIAFQLGIAAR